MVACNIMKPIGSFEKDPEGIHQDDTLVIQMNPV
jgi:hypothetical protein